MLLLRFLCLLLLFTADIRAFNHWIVSETGLIQSKEESPFLMARPFDLLSFMNQDTRWQNIFNMYDDLLLRQKIINSLWNELEEQSDISTHVIENEYCNAVEDIENIDWYKNVFDGGKNMGISPADFMIYDVDLSKIGDIQVPDCKKISSLTFSMSSFEHLEAMINRGHLNASPEKFTIDIVSREWTVKEYGHWLSEVLHKNTTSWVHYNLAAFFWRMNGNAPKALECSRRAVHHAPRRYKAVSFLCMGSILHRCNKTEDAIIVLGAAVDHAPRVPINHFVLGLAYAVQGDFNSSMKHLNTSLKLDQNFELSKKYCNAVLCHNDMLTKIQYTQRTLKKLSVELGEFRDIENQWFRTQAAFLKTMKHEKEYNYKSIDENCVKIEELTHLNIKELQKDRDRNNLVRYLVNDPKYNESWSNKKGITALDTAYVLQSAVDHLSTQTGEPNKNLMDYNLQTPRKKTEILKEIGPLPSFPELFPDPVKLSDNNQAQSEIRADIKIKLRIPDFSGEHLEKASSKKTDNPKVLYPSSMKVNRNKEDFDTDSDWPSNLFCEEAKPGFPEDVDAVCPVFLPFEHKGLSLKTLLTDKIGVPALEEHELPWHPPVCPNDKELASYSSKKGIKVQLVSEAMSTEYLRSRLLMYVSQDNHDVIKNIQDAEIGQRIYSAMQKKLAPKWVLHTLASLYWRVRGNSMNALNCLLLASRTTDTRYRDVVLVSLASVCLEMGLLDEALDFADVAHIMSPFEPPTNFLLSQLHNIKKNQKAQLFHMKQVLRLEPHYMGGYARNLMNAWSCLMKQSHLLKQIDNISSEDMCAETEAGISMVCERDGENCRVTNIRCSQAPSKESSTLVRMLEVKNDNIEKATLPAGSVKSSFNKIIEMMPMERFDLVGHQLTFDLMITTFQYLVETCRDDGCGFELEQFRVQLDECTNVPEVEQWLTIVCFEQELTESDYPIPLHVAAMTPSNNKKIPDCKVPFDTEDDFFLSRILAVDTDNWGPLRTLSQEIKAVYTNFNYGLLGAKIAKFVETKPRSWSAALVAGWWCGAGGRGACAARCLAAAHALAPRDRAHRTLRPLIAMLHMQSKTEDALAIAYLSFYMEPKSKSEAFIVGLLHYDKGDLNAALWMNRYALAFDNKFVPALHCLHAAICQATYGKDIINKPHQTAT